MQTFIPFKHLTIFIGFLFLGLTLKAQSDWTAVGGNDYELPAAGASAQETGITSLNGVLYFYYVDGDNGGKISVRKFIDDKWEYVGNPAFGGNASNLNLVFDAAGTPYIAYKDYDADKVWVKKLVGSNWEDVGTELANVSVDNVTMVIDGNNKPYVTFYNTEYGSSDYRKISVLTLNGGLWESVAPEGLATDLASSISLAIGDDNVPYIAFVDGNSDVGNVNYKKGIVKKLTGTGWELVGGASISNNKPSYFSITINNNIPYVAFKDTDVDKPFVMKYDGAWQEVASTGGIAGYTSIANVDLNFNGTTPYLTFRGNDKPRMKKLNIAGDNWEDVGGSEISEFFVTELSTTIISGTPYVFYKASGDVSSTTLKKLNVTATAWEKLEQVQPLIASSEINIAIINNMPYVVMVEGDEDEEVTVLKKFNGTAWEQVGADLWNAATFLPAAFVYESGGTIYVSYFNTDGSESSDDNLQVKKLDGENWVDVASTAFADLKILDAGISFYNGTPYIAYVYINDDDAGAITVEVKKLNAAGDGWESVGNSAVYDGDVAAYKLSFDAVGNPLVLVNNSFDGLSTIMVKLNTLNEWTASAPQTFADASTPSYDFSPDGTPYMTYYVTDGDTHETSAIIKKFDGTNWIAIGSSSFLIDADGGSSLAFGQDGTPYVFYADGNNRGRGAVKKFNSTSGNWEDLGSFLPTASSISYGLAQVSNSTLFVVYESSGSLWMKKIGIPESVLPLTLVNYTAKAESNYAKLQWQTATETNNKYFVIYRSGDGEQFVEITRIAGAGNSSTLKNYNYYDRNPLNGNNYYKLVQVDNNGKATDLGIRTLSFTLSAFSLQLYPNPTVDKVTLNFEKGRYTSLMILNLSGQVLQRRIVQESENNLTVSLDAHPAGIYLLKLTGKDGTEVKKVLKK